MICNVIIVQTKTTVILIVSLLGDITLHYTYE